MAEGGEGYDPKAKKYYSWLNAGGGKRYLGTSPVSLAEAKKDAARRASGASDIKTPQNAPPEYHGLRAEQEKERQRQAATEKAVPPTPPTRTDSLNRVPYYKNGKSYMGTQAEADRAARIARRKAGEMTEGFSLKGDGVEYIRQDGTATLSVPFGWGATARPYDYIMPEPEPGYIWVDDKGNEIKPGTIMPGGGEFTAKPSITEGYVTAEGEEVKNLGRQAPYRTVYQPALSSDVEQFYAEAEKRGGGIREKVESIWPTKTSEEVWKITQGTTTEIGDKTIGPATITRTGGYSDSFFGPHGAGYGAKELIIGKIQRTSLLTTEKGKDILASYSGKEYTPVTGTYEYERMGQQRLAVTGGLAFASWLLSIHP